MGEGLFRLLNLFFLEKKADGGDYLFPRAVLYLSIFCVMSKPTGATVRGKVMKIFFKQSMLFLFGFGGLFLSIGNAFSSTLYSSDFESGIGTEWSATNLNSEVLDPFTVFSGRFGNNTQTLMTSNLVVGANYSIFFDLYIIDSWDGGADRFNVDVAASNYFSHSFHYNASSQTYPDPPDLGPANYGFWSYNDSIYRNVEVGFHAVSNTAEIAFYGSGLGLLSDESWGIDNVSIQDYEATVIEATSLPSGSLASAVAWFTIMADRHLTEATANDAANFDLRAAGVDGLFDTGDDSLYTLTPTFDGRSTVTFSFGATIPLQYGSYRFQSLTNLVDSSGAPVDAFTHTFTLQESTTGRLEDLSNDSRVEADSLMPLTESPDPSGFLTAHGSGSFSSAADNDYWKFEAEAGDVITAWLDVERSDVKPSLYLYNASGGQLIYVNNWTWYSRIQNYTITTPGTYYLLADPYYDQNPKPSYTLRLDVGRDRALESEANDTPAQANVLEWVLDGSSLKVKTAGALVRTDDLFNLGFLNAGNAMSISVRFPAESTLDAANISASIELADGSVLYSTNMAVFAYNFTTNAMHYLRLHSDDAMDVLGQYVLDLTLLDTGAPFVESSTLPMAGTTNSAIIDRFTVHFSEFMNRDTVTNPASFRLSSSGADGVWGNGDDELYLLTPMYSENSLTADFGIEQGPLQPERDYRFEANTNLTDRLGNAQGSDYLQAFRMESLPDYFSENRSNGSAALATPLGTVTNVVIGSFAFLESMVSGDNPVDLEAVDLTGDGVLDLVVANFNSDQIQILEGLGDGTFTVLTNLVVGDAPRQTTVGYFNADAYPDIAVANEYSDTISILLGQGGGLFAPKVDVVAGDAPFDIAAGDLNGDGHVDLAVALNNAAQVRVLFGDGTGAFNSYTNYAVGSNPQEIEIADLNGDFEPDVTVANYSSDTVGVLLNNGSGALASAVSYACGDTPRCLSVGDMNNDGFPDLVVGNITPDTISILLGDGDGTFNAPSAYTGPNGPADLSLKDINGDGFLDVLVAAHAGHRLTTLLNAGDGTLGVANYQYPINYYPHSLVVADFDGDGLEDVVITETSYDHLYIYKGIGQVELPEDPVDSGMRFGAGRGNMRDTGDYDYWSFSADAGDQVVLAMQTPGNPTASQLKYYLLDPAGTQVGAVCYSDYYGSHGQSLPLTIPSEGTYTAVVRYHYQYWGEYRLRVTKVPESQQLETENNNTTGEAKLLGFAVNGNLLENTIGGYVGVADPKGDYFSLGNLTAGTVIRVDRDQPSNSGLEPLVEILFEDGNPVALGSNQVLQLDGNATDYAMVNPVADFPATALTYELWMRTADTTKQGSPVSYALSAEDNEVLLFDYRNFAPHINGSSYTTGISANDGRWHHIAWTWDGVTGTSLLYKDGELVHSNGNFRTGYSLVDGGILVLGQDQDSLGGGFSASQAFMGIMDEVRVWNTVRSPAEIQSNLYNSLAGNEAGLVSYWNFDDLTADDQTANTNDLTLAGGARLLESDLQGDSASQPTYLEFTTTTNGIYYVRMVDYAGTGDLLNQYQLDISLEDQIPPFVSGTSLPLAGSLSDAIIDHFTLSFSEEMTPASVSDSANYDLRSAGVDGLLDTGDDEVYSLLPSYVSGLVASFVVSDGPLQPGAVRLSVSTGLRDRMGWAMASAYVQVFTNELLSGFVAENRDNGSMGLATSLGQTTSSNPDGFFAFSAQHAVGDAPNGVALADLDGDSILDAAVANYNSDTLSILLGSGDGTFLLATNIVVGDAPAEVAAGLLNDDGFMDLVTVNLNSDNATVLFGDGTGEFTNSITCYVGNAPRDVVLADLNGDGELDLIAANDYSDSVGVLLGQGDGTFAAAVQIPCGDAPYSVAAGDIDGDGFVDVAVANFTGDSLGILLGNGDGTLQPVVQYAAGNGARSVVIADLNVDGRMDVAVANYYADNISIFQGLENGTLTNSSTWAAGDGPVGSLICADMDLDGDLDLAVATYYAHRTSVLMQGEDGSFDQRIAYYDGIGSPCPIDIAYGDLDQDGIGDFVVANSSRDSMSVFLATHPELMAESPAGSGLFSAFGYGNIHDALDSDYWSFSAQAGDVVTVACEMPGHIGASGLFYELYDREGTRLTYFYGDYYNGGYGQSVPIVLPADGRYAVRVAQYRPYRGEYNVAVQLARPPLQPESEANNDIANADAPLFALNAGRSEAQVCGFVNWGGVMDDYYSLGSLPSGTVVQVFMEFPEMSELAPYLQMVDATGSILPTTTNQMLSLDGSSDYMRHATTGIDPRSGTVEGWIYPKESTDWGFWQTHDSTGENWADWIAMFAYYGNPSTFYFRMGNGLSGSAQDLTFGTTNYIPAYAWSHLAFTWGDTNLNVYVNGTLIVSRNDAVLQDGMDPYARMGLGHGRWLNGWMDEFRIWDRPLSQAEVNTYKDQTLTGSESGLVSYWNFDGNTLDATANGNDGELFNQAQLVDEDHPEDPSSYPTDFTFTTPDSGAYYIRVGAAVNSAKLTSQYILNLSTYDSTIPYVASETLPMAGTTNELLFNTFSVTFSEEMDVASVTNPANILLVGTSNSTAYALAVDYASGLTANLSVLDGPLQPDGYRFTVSTNVTDRSGTSVITYTNEFVMTGADGYLLESRQNGDADPYITLNGAGTNLLDGTFSPTDSLLTGDGPLELASGLFDSDGFLDLAVANRNSHTVSILTGTGTNTFTISTNISVGFYPRSVAVGLIDGDAHLDLAVANEGPDTVTVLLGNGSGNFTNAGAYAVGSNPYDVVLADFDGDGALDLVTANPGNNTMSVLLGIGDGTFGLKTDYSIGNSPERLAVIDLNQDGTNDLVVASRTDGTLHFYQGQGDGTFVNTTNRLVGTTAGTVRAADLNLDGITDLVCVDSANDRVAVLIADGLGGFQSLETYWTGDLPIDLDIRDLDGDSVPDLVVVNQNSDSLAVLYGNGYGQFSAPGVTSTAADPAALCLGDFDLDGNLEVAVAHYNNDTVRIYSPNTMALLPVDAADGSVRQQHGYGTMDSASDVDNWTFFASAGDQLVLGTDVLGHSTYYSRFRYEIYAPDGVRILNLTSDVYGYGESLPSSLTMSGNYRLRIIPVDNYFSEYRFRVTTVSPPMIYETENNDSIGNADVPEFTASVDSLLARMAGSIEGNDANGDYFKLGNLGVGTEIDLQVEFPQVSILLPALGIFDPAGTLVATGSPASNLTFTTTGNGDFTVRISDAASTRGLDALYRLQLTLSDSTAPVIESISLPAESAQVDDIIYAFNVVFSEGMDAASVADPASYELVNAGADDVFGTGDDEVYDVEVVNFDGGAVLMLNVVQSPLQPGLFRFSVDRTVSDRMGNPMVLDVVRTFEITTPANRVYEGRNNDTPLAATAMVLIDDPDGLRAGGARGSLKDTADLDYFSFVASSNETLVLGIDQIEYANARSLRYRVVDSNEVQVMPELISDYYTQRGQTAPFSVPTNGTYYVRVSSYHDYRGEYQVRILAATPPRILETESNSDIASANLLMIQTTGSTHSASAAGYISHSADNDYFEIGPVTNDMTILVGVSKSTNSVLVPAVSVYNASGSYMPEEGVVGDGSAEVRITANNSYFVAVRGADSTGGFGQDYVLDTEILPTGEVIIPNLRVTQVTVPSVSGIVSGASVSFSYVVKNEGSAATEGGTWLDRVVLSQNKIMGDFDDYPLGSYVRAGDLDAGAAYTNLVSVDLPDGIEGPFYIVVYTDFGDQVDERLFEGDNTAVSATTFAIALADYPDLRVEGLSVSGSNEVGQVLSIDWNTVNRGTAVSGAIYERVRIVRTDTGADLLNQTFPVSGPIAVNVAIPHSLSFTTTVGVAHQVVVTTDSANEEFEYSGSHADAELNTASEIKPVVNYYDVVVSASSEAGGSAVGGGHWPAGSIVTVNALVNTHVLPYTFVNWTTSWGGFQSSASNYVFLLTQNRTLRANFILPQFVLSASRQPESGGSVYGAGSYDYASTNVLRAYPRPGYRFGHWSEGAVDLGAATSVTNVMLTDHALTAWFEELNPFHDVVTATEPADVATVTGEGHYINGTTAVFSAPQMPTNTTSRFLFQRLELNGGYLTTSASYTNTFTTLQPSNMTVVARYTSQPIEPQVRMVSRNLQDPVPATTNFAVGIVFDRSMNPMVEPLVLFSNTVDQSSFTASSNGVWGITTTSNDTFSLAPITWGSGMDGDYLVQVSLGTDLYGEAMGVTNAATIEVNSTPPDNPLFNVVSSNATSVTLAWLGYVAPSDLYGFRLYRETNAFSKVGNFAPAGFVSAAALSADLIGVELDTDYYVAAAAMDVAGNMDTAVKGLFVRVDSVVPPAVDLLATGQGADDVLLSWNGYDTTSLFGLEGFEVYSETTDFADVAGLTPISSVDVSAKSLLLQNLDRQFDHYFAVVGFNGLGQRVTAVTTASWSDPYAGLITENLAIDGNYEIYRDLTVASNAILTLEPGTTLRFAQGAGLWIDGALVAEGTVFEPITLTSASASPDRGDWNGLVLGPNASASSLRHLWVMYGHGIQLDGCAPVATALSALFNASSGLALVNNAALSTEDLLAQYNAVGLMQSDTSILSVSNSIGVNNDTNAFAAGVSPLLASDVWWGSTNAAEVAAGLEGSVVASPYLVTEPLLTPAAEPLDGLHDVGTRTVAMNYACRIAESFRVSEDFSFAGVFFYDFVATNLVLLSEGGGSKTLYIQYRNVNGETNAPIVLPLNYVTDGPTLQSFNFSEGQSLDRPYVVDASATSPLGVAVSEFYVDDVLVASTNGGSLKVLWDIREEADGLHRVKFLARDPQDAFSTQACNVWISHVPPPVPVWTLPSTGTVTAASTIAVAGTAEPLVTLRITRNAAVVANTLADIDGNFAASGIPMVEGANDLVVVAYDDLGTASSSALRVIRDTGDPEAVNLDTVQFSSVGGIYLEWSQAPVGEAPTSFRVFWDTNSFASAAGAANTGNVVSVMSANVAGLADGHYYFGVIGFDGAGNKSVLSNLMEADVDTTPPTFAVGYDRSSPVGPGILHVVLSANETLSGTPDIIFLPFGATGPTMLALTNTAPNTFEGDFMITSLTPSGLVQVRVSASDQYGNIFNAAPVGMDLEIDTTPPSATLETVPATLVQVQSNTTMLVNLVLSEVPKTGTSPQIGFNPPAGATLNVPMSGSGLNWSGSVPLNPLMGSGYCTFTLSVSDALDNLGTEITAGVSVEIYNTALPTAPGVPNLLDPVAQKGGNIHLVWYPSATAESYNLYRVPGSNGIPATVAVGNIMTNIFDDVPPADGAYRYAVSAVRRGSESGLSTVYTEFSDRTPPGAPTNMGVQLKASGVEVNWDAPTSGEYPIRYNIYRNDTKIRSVNSPIPVTDYPPRGTSDYVVASADWLGNEAFSTTNEFVMLVPAVRSFEVLVNEDQPPSLTWERGDSSIVGVNLYRNGQKLNSSPLTTTSRVDDNYSGSSIVEYSIKSVDSQGQEGPARVAKVYRVGFGLDVNAAVSELPLLGYFDQYGISTINQTVEGAFPLDSIELRRTYSGGPVVTVTQSVTNLVPPSGRLDTAVPMAAMDNAVAQSVRVRLLQTQDASGAQVVYQRLFSFTDAVIDSQMVGVSGTNTPVAGALANFKVRIFNRGLVEMDVVLSTQNGSLPGAVYVSLKNGRGEEVSLGQFRGSLPGMLLSDDGRGYVTVVPGASVEVWVNDLLVPEALSESGSVTVEAGVSTLYYKLGTVDEQVSGPITGTEEMSLNETPYYGTASADKANYANDEQILIAGQALRRSDNTPLPNTPLNIGFAMDGYRWHTNVVTDAAGDYALNYPVQEGISGQLTIWAAHPDMADRLDQVTVGIYRMYVLPPLGDVRMSKNDTFDISLRLYNPGEEPLGDIQMSVRAYRMDGTNEVDVTSIDALPLWSSGLVIPPNETEIVPLRFMTVIDAPSNAVVELRFVSDKGASDTFLGNMTLLEAVPVIDVVEPAAGYVDVTVNRGKIQTRTVTLVNHGVRDLKGVTMTLPTTVDWITPMLQPEADGLIHLPDLAVGASNTFDVVFMPPEGIEMGRFSDQLVVSGTNHPSSFNVRLFAMVSSADKGQVQFYVQNTLSLPVPNATIRLRNRLLGTELDPVYTGTNGLVVVENLQEGLWYWQIAAPGHGTTAGSVEVVPDQTVAVESRLTKQLVTVTFSVVPVPFTDRYEIVIEQTFETHVPMPVLVVTPTFKEFQGIDPGFSTRFTATVKNKGLIALNDVHLVGEAKNWGEMTPLITYMPKLNPMQEVEVPIQFNYYGTSEGDGQSAQGLSRQSAYTSCMRDMVGAILGFSDNLNAIIDGAAFCPGSRSKSETKKAIKVLTHSKVLEHTSQGVLVYAAAFGCLFADGGSSGGNDDGGSSGEGGAFEGGGCFAPGTLALLEDGRQVAIENLVLGDRVRCGVESHELAEVSEVITGTASRWVEMKLSGTLVSSLSVTDEHLLWVDGKGWTAAQALVVGDPLFNAEGEQVNVLSARAVEEDRPFVTVRLKGDFAFYANGVLVRDQCGWWIPPDEPSASSEEVAP